MVNKEFLDNYSEIIDNINYAFQPIIHTLSGKIFGVEALIRIKQEDPKFNEIQDIFDYAFEQGILYELDLALREKAIKKFSKIEIENLKLFYNLDNRIIYNKSFAPGNTTNILEKYNLNKNTIIFELSEKGTHIEQSALSTMIQTYKSTGYSIAIDDFGIGVSGLKLLYFSEANIVKLDRFFITNIDKDKKKKLFCSSIINLAHIMGMKIVVEGIETINEYYTCKNIGADFTQGFLIQKPTLKINEIQNTYSKIIDIINNDKRKTYTTSISKEYIEYIKPLNIKTPLYDLFLYFKENTKNSFVPIVDDYETLIGVIYEVDIKKISYSQYGLSLAKNETYSLSINKFISNALCVEETWEIDKVLEIYNQDSKKNKGIFITKSNVYKGFVNLNALLTLSYQRNLEIATNKNPLTKLPGNEQINKFLSNAFLNSEPTHILYFDFNNFKIFNDCYGFRQGDRAILIFSELIQKRYPKNAFIAHIGGDDFFIGLKYEKFENIFELTKNILIEFRNSCVSLYTQKDKDNNCIICTDRFNIRRKFDLLSCSCAIVNVSSKSNNLHFDNILSLIKKSSKKHDFPISASIL